MDRAYRAKIDDHKRQCEQHYVAHIKTFCVPISGWGPNSEIQKGVLKQESQAVARRNSRTQLYQFQPYTAHPRQRQFITAQDN